MDKEREQHGLESNVVFVAKCGKRYEVTKSIERVIEWVREKSKELKKKR
jgi:hypothetical protein